MDYPILLSATRALRLSLRGTSVADLRQDDRRFRLVFVGPEGSPRSLSISIEPTRPWIGRPVSRAGRRAGGPTRFEALLRRSLCGLVLHDLTLAAGDRIVTLSFADGHALEVDLVRHRANVTLVGANGSVVGAARARPPAKLEAPPPDSLGAAEIDDRVGLFRDHGLDLESALARAVRGVGAEAVRLVVEEARASGRSAGEILAERLARIADGEIEPLVLAPEDPREMGTHGDVDVRHLHLLPWPPARPPVDLSSFRGADAAATVGLFHDAVDGVEARSVRRRSIVATLAAEEQRVRRAIGRARDDLGRFEDAESHRRRGEALLAGITRASRVGDAVRVPDPYSIDGREITIPVPPGLPIAACAEECFRRHRRAVRGQQLAASRLSGLEERLHGLRGIGDLLAADTPAAMARAEGRLRELGLALDAARVPRGGRPMPVPRAAGVRIFVAPGGETVLAGRSGVGNDRVTFRLGAPDDIWLHAAGTAGAHVILRGVPGRKDPDAESLRFAAGIAAWFSEARDAAAVDVQWTRRKLVRRRRGGPPGSVLLKRFQVIRVSPAVPREVDDLV